MIATALNQGFDLNDPNTPDHIYERFNQAYLAAGSPNGPLNAGSTARARGTGLAFGFLNTATGQTDLNLSSANGTFINFEARVPILGFNVPEALLLQSKGDSDYKGAQFSLTKRMSRGIQFNMAYTFSKSEDVMSTDPGSTAGSGKPDVPNSGFIAQGDSRNLEANRGLSDFDRTHRFSTNFVWEIPSGNSNNRFVKGWSLSGFFQAQSGTPFTVFSSEPDISNASQLTLPANATDVQYLQWLARGSGGIYRPGFGRPNLTCPVSRAVGSVSSSNLNVIDRRCFSSPVGGFGDLGRNAFRGPSQKRFDLSLVKNTKINERMSFELGFDLFNVFDTVNFANPNSDLQDAVDFGVVTNTVGGPRVGQFRARLRF